MQIRSPAVKPETTGEAGTELKPSDPQNTRINKDIPSSPIDASKCGPGKDQERPGPEGHCP